MFFSNTHVTQLLVPLDILMSKIYLKYIPIHIHNFEHTSVIMNVKLSIPGFLFHRNINRRENKGQIQNWLSITMRKNKEYISDVQQKITELHKLERWGGEFEWTKTLQGPQLENCRKRLSFGVRKPFKKLSNSTYITTCCLGGLQEKLSSLIPKQSPAYSVVRHDWNFKWDWLLCQM